MKIVLGDLIREYRFKYNLSMRKFAKFCRCSPAYISRIERNMNPQTPKPFNTSPEMVYKIATVMGLSTGQILSDNASVDCLLGQAKPPVYASDAPCPILPTGQFIILNHSPEGNFRIVTGATAQNALQEYVNQMSIDSKPFKILCESRQMNLAELIAYANTYLLPSDTAIHEFYSLGETLYKESVNRE